jgi:hypothetical protein
LQEQSKPDNTGMDTLPDPFEPAPAEAIPAWLAAPSAVVSKLLEAMHDRQMGDTPRAALVGKLASIVLEQHRAIVLLLRSRLNSSALALSRCIHESFMKTQWALRHASEKQVRHIYDGSKGMPDMAQLIEALKSGATDFEQSEGAFWDRWKRENYPVLHDYAHTGPVQVSYWINGSNIEPSHPVEVLQTLAGHASKMALFATLCVSEAAQDGELLALVVETMDWLDLQLPPPTGHSTHENGSGATA